LILQQILDQKEMENHKDIFPHSIRVNSRQVGASVEYQLLLHKKQKYLRKLQKACNFHKTCFVVFLNILD